MPEITPGLMEHLREFLEETACTGVIPDNGQPCCRARALIRELDALPAGQEAEGWKLVPIKPTEEMIEAGWIDKEDVSPKEIYWAMLSAAPPPHATELEAATHANSASVAPFAESEVERLAKIGRDAWMGGNPMPFDRINPNAQEDWRRAVRAILAARPADVVRIAELEAALQESDTVLSLIEKGRQPGWQDINVVREKTRAVLVARPAAERGSEEQVEQHAHSIAQMVIEWIEGGEKFGTDWKSGLADVIAHRLRRLRRG